MINLDEDALICDLAETYRIYDYRSLPVRLVATLSAGLRDDSRIKLKAADSPVSKETMILAMIADRIELFRRSFSDKHKDDPVSVVEMLLGNTKKKVTSGMSFKTSEEFEAMLAKIRGEQ